MKHYSTPRVVPTPVDDLAVMVWAELDEARDTGLSAWEVQKRLPELSKHQVKRGLERINHVLQLTRERPMVHFQERGRGVVYQLSQFCPDYKAFAMRRLRELVTRSHTELVRAESAVLKWPDGLAAYLPKMLKRAIEDIEDMIGELGVDDGEG